MSFKDGITPLMSAIVLGNFDCIEVLLQLGADQSIRDQMGRTAYDRASEAIRRRFSELDPRHSAVYNTLPFRLPIYPIYVRLISTEILNN